MGDNDSNTTKVDNELELELELEYQPLEDPKNWSAHGFTDVSPWSESNDILANDTDEADSESNDILANDTDADEEDFESNDILANDSDEANSEQELDVVTQEKRLNQLNIRLSQVLYLLLMLFGFCYCSIFYVINSQDATPLNYGYCRIGSYTFTPERCRSLVDNYRLH